MARISTTGPHAQPPRNDDRHVHAQCEDVGVGEVDELQDAVHHRVAQGDEGIQGADGQSINKGLQQLRHDEEKSTNQKVKSRKGNRSSFDLTF